MNQAIEAPIERLPMTADGFASLQDELRHRAKGAVVEVITPGGARAYKIDEVEWH